MNTYCFLYRGLTNYLIACLKKLAVNGDKVYIIYHRNKTEVPYELPSNKFIKLYCREEYSNPRSLLKLIESINPTKLFCSGWRDLTYLKVCYSFKRTIPIVLLMDNIWSGIFRQRIWVLGGRKILNKIFTHIWIAGIPQLSYASRLGFPNSQIKMGCYSADVELFSTVIELQEIREKKKGILFIGRFVKEKNLSLLAKAFKELNLEFNNEWILHCVGDGVIKIKNDPRIIHYGYLKSEQLKELAKECSFFVLPSKKEAWGVVIHEMMCSGLPVICSDVVGAASLFIDQGRNGYIFKNKSLEDLKDKMRMVMCMNEKDYHKMHISTVKGSYKWSTDEWADVAKSFTC